MNILGIGAPELILIFMIAIVVAGPKRMIRWAYTLGIYVGKLREMWADVAKVIQAEVDAAGLDVQVPKDIPTRSDVGRMLQQAAKPMMDPINKVAKEVDEDYRRVQSDMASSMKVPSITEVQKPAALPQPEIQPVSTSGDLGSWGTSPKSTSNGAKPATPDLGTWGAVGDSDVSSPS
jgi:Sec-independent protein translocase protein TatA